MNSILNILKDTIDVLRIRFKDNLELQNNILNFVSKYKDNISFKEKLYEIKNWEKSLIEKDNENITENMKI